MAANGTRLPEANEFSPGQIGGIAGLTRLLRLLKRHGGDKDAVVSAVRTNYFTDTAPKLKGKARLKRQQTRAYNLVLGASKYGLLDLSTYDLTSFGSEILAARTNKVRARMLAAHVLRHLHGLEVLDCVRALQERGTPVTKTNLQNELERRGFDLPRATTHHTKLLGWLREASVVGPGYEIDDDAVSKLVGITIAGMAEWEGLTAEQRAFLRTLRKLAMVHGNGSLPARDVVDATALEYGPVFHRPDQLAARVFKPLVEKGWIKRDLKSKGRGGKSGAISPKPKLLATDLGLMPEETGEGIPADLRPQLQTPISDVRKDLRSRSKHKKGIALELLALRIAIDLGLTPVRMRERSASTGGAEVDVIAEGKQLQFTRWLIQCKNTKHVTVAALAKEIGMATLLNAQVVALVTTGSFSKTVVSYADLVSATTALQVVLIPGFALDTYAADGPRGLWALLRTASERTLELKRPQVAFEQIASP